MKVALLGMMQSGKSSLLAAISGKDIPEGPTVAISEETINVPDKRIDWLANHYQPNKTIYSTIECLDIPGFYFTDDAGRASARRLFGDMRMAGMLVLVVRAFQEPSVAAYRGTIDPERDLNELKEELLLADLELISTRIERLEKQLKKHSKTAERDKAELELQKKLEATIEEGNPLSALELSNDEKDLVRSLNFLTLKPMMVVINVGEDDLDKEYNLDIDASVPVIALCCSLEKELAQLDTGSREEFMRDLGIEEKASDRFVASCYEALGLISFLTSGKDEVRAWPIVKGSNALEAAGKIHSDIQRGFIRAETIAFDELVQYGDEKAVKAAGRARLEGKTYIVQDGDIIEFRFNV
ncbi:MAG: redox-regulated ATPase YchF [Acidobacteria bacterium]|nr:MAG: redox-regulated ATPase YchF [Acidobacteriota bacterium]